MVDSTIIWWSLSFFFLASTFVDLFLATTNGNGESRMINCQVLLMLPIYTDLCKTSRYHKVNQRLADIQEHLEVLWKCPVEGKRCKLMKNGRVFSSSSNRHRRNVGSFAPFPGYSWYHLVLNSWNNAFSSLLAHPKQKPRENTGKTFQDIKHSWLSWG